MAEAVRGRVVGGEELMKALRQLDEAASEQALRLAVKAGSGLIENAAERLAPKRTRTLARSITTEIEASRTQAVARIGPSGAAIPSAAQVEFGGTIRPKRAKMLHWVDDAGVDHFAHEVTQREQPYMRPAWDENVDAAQGKMEGVLKVLVERAGTGV